MALQLELDNKVLDLVQLAVAQTLASKLDSLLPHMLEQILEKDDRSGGGLVRNAMRGAVRAELEKVIQKYLADNAALIASRVATACEAELSTVSIREEVRIQLQALKLNLFPFRKVAKAADEEEEFLEP